MEITQSYRISQVYGNVNVINQPKLNPPAITIKNDQVSIIDTLNGNFTTQFNIYADNSKAFTVNNTKSISLEDLDWTSVGDREIELSCLGTYFNESDKSNKVIFVMRGYK